MNSEAQKEPVFGHKLDGESYGFDPSRPLHVDCSADPLDVRPLLTTTLAEIDRIREEELVEGQRIVLLAGEHHLRPFGLMFCSALAFALYKCGRENAAQRMLTALEIPHSYMPGIDMHSALCHAAEESTFYMPYTNAYFMNLLQKKRIPTLFNDLSMVRRGKKVFLDPNDPFTAKFTEGSGQEGMEINITSPEGVAIRNQWMACLAMANDASVVLQNTGGGHIFGYVPKGAEFKDSLYLAYKEGVKDEKPAPYILPIILKNNIFKLRDLPQEARNVLVHSVIGQGGDETLFEVSPQEDNEDRQAYFRRIACDLAKEKRHVRKIFEHSGGRETFPFAPKGFSQMEKKIQRSYQWARFAARIKNALSFTHP